VRDCLDTLLYLLTSKALLQPRLLRAFCTALWNWPVLSRVIPAVSRRTAVAAAFDRQTEFSNIAHAPNLVAGPFLIGMEIGPQHTGDRAFVTAHIADPAPSSTIAGASANESRQRIDGLLNSGPKRFDLVNDYMVWVVWSALGATFGPGAAAIVAPGNAGDARSFFLQVRYVGAHLIIGGIAPQSVQLRAQQAALALNTRVDKAMSAIQTAWGTGTDPTTMRRNALGMLWVGHPATVQAGALVIQELFGRREIYRDLAGKAQKLGDTAWQDVAFREELMAHILELLRFRPVFPAQPRYVMRDTVFESDSGLPVPIKGGASLAVFTIGAMFDSLAVENPESYIPDLGDTPRFKYSDDKYMLFGLGARSCVAKYVVPQILLNAITGLLLLPDLDWANGYFSRMQYDGPIVTEMELCFK
jgi:cytochrome P450